MMAQAVGQDVAKHAVRILEELHRMKEDKDHCDFIVQVRNDVYHTHRNILSAGSDYFKAMLRHDTKESREGRVVLKDVDFECVKKCIDFIYSGKFEIPDEKIIELLHVAIMMQLEDVKLAISDILEKSFTVENYFSIRNVCDMYGLDDVASRSIIFLQENTMKIANESGFAGLEKNDLFSLLKSSKSKLLERERLMLLLKWIERCGKKKGDLYDCLKLIAFDKISQTFWRHLLETHPIIKCDSRLHEVIRGHLRESKVALVKKKESIILFDEDTDCILSFNPISEKITKFHDAKFMHLKFFATIVLDLYIYILCDNKSVHRLNFRRTNSNWQKMKDTIFNHGQCPRSVSLHQSIFVIGGSSAIETKVVERFDPSVNQWFELQNKQSSICDASLLSFDDSIYCIGGLSGDVVVSSFCRFTPSSLEWVDLEPMRNPVCNCGAVAVDQKIFVIGGWGENENIKNVECYDVSSAQWTSLPSTNALHDYNTAYHIGNFIFVVDRFNDFAVMEKYDLLNKKWYSVKKESDQYLCLCSSAMVMK